MKKKELVEVKIKLYKHQIEWFEESARRAGIQMGKRRHKPAWVHWQKLVRKNLDEYIFFLRPQLKEIIESRKSKFQA